MNNIAKIQEQAGGIAENTPDCFVRDPVQGPIAQADRTQLILKADCIAMIDRIDSARMPSHSEAKSTANRILLCYSGERKDPVALAVLIAEFTNDLLKVPLHLHDQVFDLMTKSDRFFPTRASLTDTIERVLAPRNAARHTAVRHLGRHRILDKHHPETVPQTGDLRQTLERHPKASPLTEAVDRILSTLPGHDPEADCDLVSRFTAPTGAVKPSEAPITARTVSLPPDERRAALLGNHHMKRRY